MSGYLETFFSALWNVFPVALVLFAFQYLVLRRPFPHPGRVAVGFLYMFVGLEMLLLGLENGLYPLGTSMSEQLLTLGAGSSDLVPSPVWQLCLSLGAFAVTITFAAVLAEPVLTALTDRVEQVSGGTIDSSRMRIVVAFGAAIGVCLSIVRLIYGTPIALYVGPLVVLIWIQSRHIPAAVRPLAYDAGVAGISTIMVPLLIAIGNVMATAIPNRSILVDGFGLVVLAALTPVLMVLTYARIGVHLGGKLNNTK